jgi:hypothetical protein
MACDHLLDTYRRDRHCVGTLPYVVDKFLETERLQYRAGPMMTIRGMPYGPLH